MKDFLRDNGFVPASVNSYTVSTNRVLPLAKLTNAKVGDKYYEFFDGEGLVVLVPERMLPEGVHK